MVDFSTQGELGLSCCAGAMMRPAIITISTSLSGWLSLDLHGRQHSRAGKRACQSYSSALSNESRFSRLLSMGLAPNYNFP